MTIDKKLKTASILIASSLTLAVAGASHAYTLEVGDTTASIYGYAKVDLIYDVDDKLGNSVNRNAIRLDGERGSDGHTTLHAYQSRLGFGTSTPVGGSDLKTSIEGDFYGGGGGTFRLRHAFGEWNGLLAGQTWTNFGGFLGMNPTVDFTPQPGQANVGRQAQLRYTTGGFSVALEDPDSLGGKVASGFNGAPVAAASHKNRLPDLTLRYQGGVGEVSYAASALLRRLEHDDLGASQKDGATGWGLALEASAKLTPVVTLRGSIAHGDGIGGYLEGSPTAPAYIDPISGSLETIEATGGTVGISVATGPGSLTLGYGIARADLDAAHAAGVASDDTNREFQAMHLNYIWSPVRNVTYGVEVGHHTREVYDGRDGDAVRVQGMVQYSF